MRTLMNEATVAYDARMGLKLLRETVSKHLSTERLQHSADEKFWSHLTFNHQ